MASNQVAQYRLIQTGYDINTTDILSNLNEFESELMTGSGANNVTNYKISPVVVNVTKKEIQMSDLVEYPQYIYMYVSKNDGSFLSVSPDEVIVVDAYDLKKVKVSKFIKVQDIINGTTDAHYYLRNSSGSILISGGSDALYYIDNTDIENVQVVTDDNESGSYMIQDPMNFCPFYGMSLARDSSGESLTVTLENTDYTIYLSESFNEIDGYTHLFKNDSTPMMLSIGGKSYNIFVKNDILRQSGDDHTGQLYYGTPDSYMIIPSIDSIQRITDVKEIHALEDRYFVNVKMNDFEYVGYLYGTNGLFATTTTLTNEILSNGQLHSTINQLYQLQPYLSERVIVIGNEYIQFSKETVILNEDDTYAKYSPETNKFENVTVSGEPMTFDVSPQITFSYHDQLYKCSILPIEAATSDTPAVYGLVPI